jgi:reverse gyrase
VSGHGCEHDSMIKCFRCSEVARLGEDNRELVKATGSRSVGGALLTIADLRAVAEAADRLLLAMNNEAHKGERIDVAEIVNHEHALCLRDALRKLGGE